MGVLKAKVNGEWIDVVVGQPGPAGPQGVQGIQGPQGIPGPTGPVGAGVVVGGSVGQVLSKKSATDYDTQWVTPSSIGAWTNYTPQVDQGVVNMTKSIVYARYVQIGKTVMGAIALVMTSAGTAGQPMSITLPVATAYVNVAVGSGFVVKTGTKVYNGTWNYWTTTKVTLVVDDGNSSGPGAGWGQLPNLALASNDIIRGTFMYEVA
jgi:hypothetical protein